MATDEVYDLAIIGLGAVGTFALDAAAQRGLKTVGIDQYVPPHAQGSTHGETRLIREAYGEGQTYIPLLRRSLEIWRQIDSDFGGDVFFETGVQYLGPANHSSMLDTRSAAGAYDILLTDYSQHPLGAPSLFQTPDDWDHFYEHKAGYLKVENVILKLLQRAQTKSASVMTGTKFEALESRNSKFTIRMDNQVIVADKVIMALGPWAHQGLAFLDRHLELERHILHWFRSPDASFKHSKGFLPFAVHLPGDRMFYGFPQNDQGLVKIAEHSSGRRFKRHEDMDRGISTDDIASAEAFRDQYLPSLGALENSISCMYTMSPDGHFIVDHHPEHQGVVFAAGLSGHGYKFATAMGDSLVEMAIDGKSKLDWSFFGLSRF